jgi:histidine phosphotransferase ChpT
MTAIVLEPLDLAALLCSRICHDIINPVGAIMNGLEVLEEDKDPVMRQMSIDLIRNSAQTASARLQFCRLAFGAAGSAGATIDTGDAENVTRGLIGDDKIKLVWNVPRVLMPKNKVKVVLNLCLIATTTIPRGGVVEVDIKGEGDATTIRVEAKGTNAKIAHGVAQLLNGEAESGTVESHGIQAYFTGLVARAAGLQINLNVVGNEAVTFEACAPSHAAAEEAQPHSAA